MKKIIAAAALAAASVSTFAAGPFGDLFDKAPVVSLEYDYNHVVRNAQNFDHTQYGYLGILQPTKFGNFDFGFQGVRSSTQGFSNDNSRGYEIGYSFPIKTNYYGLSVVPRAAYGQLNHVNPAGSGYDLHPKYALYSVELQKPINEKLGAYVSFSHMGGINAASVVRANRVQAGLDYAFNDKFSLRAGYSTQNFDQYRMNGLVFIGSYQF